MKLFFKFFRTNLLNLINQENLCIIQLKKQVGLENVCEGETLCITYTKTFYDSFFINLLFYLVKINFFYLLYFINNKNLMSNLVFKLLAHSLNI